MNVLNPELIWVDGRCYRFLENIKMTHNRDPYIEENYQMDYKDSEDECYDTNIEIVPYGATSFKHTFYVPKSFFPFIVGSKHAVHKRLQAETGTFIQIPKFGQSGDIVISGADRKRIRTARRRIDLLIEATRKRLKPTHFLSVPLNDSHIITKYNMFKNEVLTNSGKSSRGVDEMIFQTPSKLHLTIALLTLLDDTERNQATEALYYCNEHIIKPIMKKYRQVSIYIQGTEIMNDDSSETNVLYAKVFCKDEILQKIMQEIVNYYSNIGLLPKNSKEVKVHLTLMSSRFKSRREEKHSDKFKTFDTTEIMKAHENTFFGETTLKEIHLSQLGTVCSNGYYQATAKIDLLENL